MGLVKASEKTSSEDLWERALWLRLVLSSSFYAALKDKVLQETKRTTACPHFDSRHHRVDRQSAVRLVEGICFWQ